MSAGPAFLYVVAAYVPRRETIAAGSLGALRLSRGWYAYVGSARRARPARVARHMRAAKPLRWHADYLFSRHPATRAWLLDVPAAGEPGAAGAAVRIGGTGPAPIAVAWSAPAADTVPAADQPGAVVPAADAVAGSAAALSTRPSGSLPPECAVAAALAAGAPAGHAVPRFGASDCGCRGHLVYFGSLRELRSAVTAAAAHTNARMCRFGYPLGYTAAV